MDKMAKKGKSIEQHLENIKRIAIEAEKTYYSNGYQPLFELMSDHGLTLLESELYEIVNCVRLMDKHQLTTNK